MSTLADSLKRALALEVRGKELITEFRYACYPDADKDELETLLADYGCHGFEAGLGVKFDRLAPLHERLLDLVRANELLIKQFIAAKTEAENDHYTQVEIDIQNLIAINDALAALKEQP